MSGDCHQCDPLPPALGTFRLNDLTAIHARSKLNPHRGTMVRHGSSHWSSGRPVKVPPAMPSEFEMQAKRLGLTPETYATSCQLRTWCERNRNRCYIPEWLLKVWHIPVDANLA